MEILVEFVVTFIVLLLFIHLLLIRRGMKEHNLYEISLIEKLFKLDQEKVNYDYMLWAVGLVLAFDFTTIIVIVVKIKSFILEILVGLLGSVALFLISYKLLSYYFNKKGWTK